MARDPNQSWTPPYIPFRTLMNLIARMEEEGVPRRIDRSYLNSMAGGMQAAVMAALRSLGLTGSEGEVLNQLAQLVREPEQRPELIREMLIENYEFAWKIAEANGTQGELDEAFKAQGISGSTLRKAVAFYLRAAKYAEMPLSPFLQVPRGEEAPAGAARRPRRSTGVRRKRAATAVAKAVDPVVATTGAGGTDDMRRRYFDMLIQKAESTTGEPDSELLDRIERLLGMAEGTTSVQSPPAE